MTNGLGGKDFVRGNLRHTEDKETQGKESEESVEKEEGTK